MLLCQTVRWCSPGKKSEVQQKAEQKNNVSVHLRANQKSESHMCYVWSVLLQVIKMSRDFSQSQGFFCLRDQDSTVKPILDTKLKKTPNKKLPFVWDSNSGNTFFKLFQEVGHFGKPKYHLELRLSGSLHCRILFLWLHLCQNLVMLSEVPHAK